MPNLMRSFCIMSMMGVMTLLLICDLAAGAGKYDERLGIPPALGVGQIVVQNKFYSHGDLRSEHQPKGNDIIWPNGDGGRGLRLLSFEAARKLTVADAKRTVPTGPDPLHHNGSNGKNP